MAFSFFNKNSGKPAKPAVPAHGASRTDDKRDASGSGGQPRSRDATTDIDRHGAKPASHDVSTERARTGAARDSSGAVLEHGFSGPQGQRAVSPARLRAPNSVMTMEVQERPFEAAPALEEAAILYANRQDAAARSALEEAVATEDLPAQAAKQAWMMLFDLFENQGRRADFDAAALQFAVRFETSPPAFNDRAAVKHPMAEAGGGPQVALTGRLDEGASKQFEHLRIVAGKNRALKVDFSKVDGINDAGAAQLRLCLAALVKSGHEVAYTGADHLTSLLVRLTEVGRADFPQAYWLLLLDLYQIQNLHAQFEEAALSYCITYEVSPPSWMDPRREPAKPASRTLIESESQPDDAFYLKGEIEGGSDSSLKGIGEFAADKQHVVIDVFHVKRMDFVAAGSLLNLVSALKASGKHVEIRSPSPLLANLFVTMGFTECARLARRKT